MSELFMRNSKEKTEYAGMVEWQFSTERCRWQKKRRLKKRDVKIVRVNSEDKDFATARRA